ncbi:hypothetical protein GCM10010174_68170 [Kutzneria viridogrisea]|uniref:Carrier domain-containing protein n=2 Tax=Kutzneria TaxID=43356 RepID=W5WLK8_9PSEU|nr:phosphopantetheine-binding protein [Kutzneria albida]AHH99054.1 hypothetical protein KALB_5693 [Kutzneria albida DSM 43870]MBA8923390.1 acyl carrier protein [Kutzneria viridogrisea]
MDATTEEVMELVRGELPGAAGVGVDTPLSEVGLTSLGSVALLVALERRFGLEFPPDLVTAETFGSVRTMADAVRSASSPSSG